jgi:predicted DNA-binding transcriptional regulator AlpA
MPSVQHAQVADDGEPAPNMRPLSHALARLSLSRSAAYRLIAVGDFPIPVLRVGARWYYRDIDLEAFLNLS